MGLFDFIGRGVLIDAAHKISQLRTELFLVEYISMYRGAKNEHSEFFNELIQKRDLIKLCLEYGIDDKLIEIKQEWFSESDSHSNSAGMRNQIDRIEESNQRVIGYLSDIENRWFRPDNLDFNDYTLDQVKKYCMYSSLYCIPKKYIKAIYESAEYKSSIEFGIKLSLLHSVWGQINLSLANYRG